MQVDFYTLIEEADDKSVDLKENLILLFDRLLQEGNIEDINITSKIAQIRAKIINEFS